MKHSKYLIIISLFVVMIMLLSACGEKKTESTADEAKPAETTVVLETTSEGGTVEQDSEGNHITKDKDGNVTEVEDKDGNPVDVAEYLTTHAWVENSGSDNSDSGSSGGNGNSSGSGKTDDSGKSGASDKSSSNNSGGSNGEKGSGKNDSSSSVEDDVEGEIPVIIATAPDEDDMIDLPDL